MIAGSASGVPFWLVGRQSELDAARELVRSLAAQAVAGPGALVLQGPSGIGKTALWLAICELAEASGLRVLRARPAEAESSFSYAALSDLLREPMASPDVALPPPQRRTLERALGVADAGAGAIEPHLVHAASTNLLLDLAGRSAVLVAIDDAPWLDPASAATLEYAARRVAGRRVAFLVAQRVDEPAPAPLGLEAALPANPPQRLWLGPLSLAALHQLLEARLGLILPRPQLVRLHALSGGVPFHALQIAQALQHRPLPPIGAPWPLPASLRDLLRARIEDLRPTARGVLQLVATAGTISVSKVERVLGVDAARRGLAELDSDLVARDGVQLRAGHPLVASTACELMSHAQLAAQHALLADVVEEPEHRARHRALAGSAPDEELAAELEAAAARARARGAPESAAELLHLARQRSPDRSSAAYFRRTLALAEALAGADDLTAARDVLDEELPRMLPGVTLGRAEMLRAEIDWYLATAPEAVAHLEAGLRAHDDPDLQADLRYRLAIFLDYDLERGHENAQLAVDLLERLQRPGALSAALLQLFWSEILLGRPPRLELLERGLAIEPPDSEIATTIPGIWWLALERPQDARRRFATMLERDRQHGQLSAEADLLTRLAEVDLFADNYAAARELAEAATSVARQHGDATADPARRVRALVDAHEGRLDEARAVAAPAAERAAGSGDHIIAMAWLVVLAFVAASQEDFAEVERIGAQSAAHMRAIGIVEPMRLGVQHERLEALAALGRVAEAEELMAALEQRQQVVPRPWLEAALVRGRARLLAAREELDAAVGVTDALGSPTGDGWRQLDRGRVLLLRGQLLRRLRLRRESAAALDEAGALFDAIGALAWARRARAEAARLGRRRPGTEDLTPAEAQVATLAAEGLTNRSIAERLTISPKTVEAHIARAYAKLGIRSRAELGRRMAAGRTDEDL